MPGGWTIEPQHGAPQGGLAAAALAHEPQGLVAANLEAHTVDGAQAAAPATLYQIGEQKRRAEIDGEILDLDDGFGSGPACLHRELHPLGMEASRKVIGRDPTQRNGCLPAVG